MEYPYYQTMRSIETSNVWLVSNVCLQIRVRAKVHLDLGGCAQSEQFAQLTTGVCQGRPARVRQRLLLREMCQKGAKNSKKIESYTPSIV